MSKLSDIIKALRDRIDASDLDASVQPIIDEDRGLPQVMIFMSPDGDSTESIRPRHQKTVSLVADLRFKYADDWLTEGADLKEELEQAIYNGPAPDVMDTLDGTALSITPVKSVISPETDSKVASVQCTVSIRYLEK